MNDTHNNFDCPRTCANYARRDICKFNALFEALGATVSVNSRTERIRFSADATTLARTALQNEQALEAASKTASAKSVAKEVLEISKEAREQAEAEKREAAKKHAEQLAEAKKKQAEALAQAKKRALTEPVKHPLQSYVEQLPEDKMRDLEIMYLRAVTMSTAAVQGWETQITDRGIRAIHPSGGLMDVELDDSDPETPGAGASVIATNFTGDKCHQPVSDLVYSLGEPEELKESSAQETRSDNAEVMSSTNNTLRRAIL